MLERLWGGRGRQEGGREAAYSNIGVGGSRRYWYRYNITTCIDGMKLHNSAAEVIEGSRHDQDITAPQQDSKGCGVCVDKVGWSSVDAVEKVRS